LHDTKCPPRLGRSVGVDTASSPFWWEEGKEGQVRFREESEREERGERGRERERERVREREREREREAVSAVNTQGLKYDHQD